MILFLKSNMRCLVDKSDTVYFPNKKAEHRKDWNIQA